VPSRETGTSYDAGGVEVVPSRNHLANDTSATAAKAAEVREPALLCGEGCAFCRLTVAFFGAQHRERTRVKAFKDMQSWIDSVIGDYTEGEDLHEVKNLSPCQRPGVWMDGWMDGWPPCVHHACFCVTL
jgi:hypothetical protein